MEAGAGEGFTGAVMMPCSAHDDLAIYGWLTNAESFINATSTKRRLLTASR